MRIKVALLEKDEAYLKRIVSVFGTRYEDELEIYSFTEYEVAIKTIADAKIDVLVVSDSFAVEEDDIPKRCAYAYLVESQEIEDINGIRAIGKYQKADLIFRQILSLYAENAAVSSKLRTKDSDCKMIAFASPAGGVGTSVAAVAFAQHCASLNKKVIYINLEDFGAADVFFSDEGQFTISEVIYALKSKKANLSLKLESSVKRDAKGVYFFSAPALALDLMEMTTEEILRMLTELMVSGGYDYIAIDLGFDLDSKTLEIYDQIDKVVFVSDGSVLANSKIVRMKNALEVLEQNKDIDIIRKSVILYNRFSNSTGMQVEDIGIPCCGGIARVETPLLGELIGHLAEKALWNDLM